jgi:hypothetical protein
MGGLILDRSMARQQRDKRSSQLLTFGERPQTEQLRSASALTHACRRTVSRLLPAAVAIPSPSPARNTICALQNTF